MTADEIKSHIDNRSDFALELRSASEFRRLGYTVEHGGTYDDPVQDKPRQFDIRSTFARDNQVVKFAAECKALSTDFPLVILRTRRTQSESFHQLIFSARPPPQAAPGHTIVQIYRTHPGSRLYRPSEFVGKSSIQVGTKKGKLVINDHEVYEKWSQAISSARDLIVTSATEYLRCGCPKARVVVVPILIVSDSCLWQVDYEDTGARASEPVLVNELDFFIAKEYRIPGPPEYPRTYSISHLKVATLTGIARFAAAVAAKNSEVWDAMFPEDDSLRRI